MMLLADVVALERARAAGTTYGKLRLWGSVGFLVATLAIGRVLDPGASAPLPATIAALLFVALLAAWTLPAKPDTLRLPVTREARVLVATPDFALFQSELGADFGSSIHTWLFENATTSAARSGPDRTRQRARRLHCLVGRPTPLRSGGFA